MIQYRSDIDGLRAIAVLAVILFHIQPDALRGGFAGVDIFFVISGFLITSILKQDLYNNSFSLAEFYERRARRILPALVTVCTITLAAFYFTFFPSDYIELAQATIAASLSGANIFFWKTIDYFATASEEKPLLHTWSLGVEEQFYLFFPLILYALDKYFPEKRVTIVISALGLLSLAFAEYAIRHFPNFAFYQLPSRFWELALGAILAYLPTGPRKHNALSIAGLLMIVLSFVLYSDNVAFPGIAALLPCLGTAFLIFSNDTNIVAQKILSRRPMIILGKMSYSLYLWHWPILAFLRYRFEQPGVISYLIATIVIFALSYASWRFVETPFRNRKFLSRRNIFLLSIISIALLSAISFAIIQQRGLPDRFSAKALTLADAAKDHPSFLYETCLKDKDKNPNCVLGNKDRKNFDLVLWGDSHAGSMIPGIDKLATEHNLKGLQLTKSSCPGLLGDYNWKGSEFADCKKLNDQVFDLLIKDKNIKYIILSARWAPIAKKIHFENSDQDGFYRALHYTAETLRKNGKTVLIIASVPEIDFNVPRCLSRQAAYGESIFHCTSPTPSAYREAQSNTLSAFSALEEDTPVFYPHMTLCKSGQCQIESGESILYFDDDHLSKDGVLFIYPDLSKRFAPYLK